MRLVECRRDILDVPDWPEPDVWIFHFILEHIAHVSLRRCSLTVAKELSGKTSSVVPLPSF